MESNKVEKLLTAYFEGNTSLEEERFLKTYFSNGPVADEFLKYQPIFNGLTAAARERSTQPFHLLEKKPRFNKKWWYPVAALLVVAFGVGSFYLAQPRYTQEEKEALAAFEKSKKAMLLLSENLNKGAEQLGYVNQFGIAKDKIFE
ncbi:hypothetical protein F3C99_10195 [Vitellibacter sp. q18]|jgi:hypothetical protein|nr:hypothetical protein [Aequorivita lutea]